MLLSVEIRVLVSKREKGKAKKGPSRANTKKVQRTEHMDVVVGLDADHSSLISHVVCVVSVKVGLVNVPLRKDEDKGTDLRLDLCARPLQVLSGFFRTCVCVWLGKIPGYIAQGLIPPSTHLSDL